MPPANTRYPVVVRVARIAVPLVVLVSNVFAQTPPPGEGGRRRGAETDDGGGRRNITPQDMQARMLTSLRERFGVTSDEEWTVISARLLKVFVLRRATGGAAIAGAMMTRGGPPQGGPDAAARGRFTPPAAARLKWRRCNRQ